MEAERFIQTTLGGDSEVSQVLNELPEQIRNKIIKQVLRTSAQPVIAAFEKMAPRSTGYSAAYRRRHGHIPLHYLIAVQISRRGPNAQRARLGAVYPEAAQAHLTDQGTVQRFRKTDTLRRSNGVVGRLKSYRKFQQKSANGYNSGAVTGTHWVEKAWASVAGPGHRGDPKGSGWRHSQGRRPPGQEIPGGSEVIENAIKSLLLGDKSVASAKLRVDGPGCGRRRGPRRPDRNPACTAPSCRGTPRS